MLRELAIITTLMLLPVTAFAHNAACWSADGVTDDVSRPDITCAPLTEKFLERLHGVTEAQLVRIMNAPGRITDDGGYKNIHYVATTAEVG